MAQKKAHEVDAWLAKPGQQASIVLLYGPDRGLVSERAQVFATATGLPLDDPFSVVRLDASDVERIEGRLVEEARTVPMFSPRRLLWVRGASAQKSIAEDVKALLAEPPPDAIVLIEAGDLKKGAPLRTAVESGSAGMALPCYADEARDVDALIDDGLRESGMTMTLDAREALRRGLGGDRLASRGEIAKLTLYAHGQREIGLDDVRAATGDVAGLSVDDAVDSILEGKPGEFDAAYASQALNGSQAYQVLAATMRQFQALQGMRAGMEGSGRGAAAVVAAARPPVFFSRRKIVERALERWSTAEIQALLARLQATVLSMRMRPELAIALVRQALLAIAVGGARRR